MGNNKKKILIVDDQPGNRKLLKDLLGFQGYDLIEAVDGEDALKKAQKIPDLILLDIEMPKLNGYQTAKELKANNSTKNIPFIMFTAQDDAEAVKSAFAAGAVDYVLKPFAPAELLRKISKALEK